MITFCIKRNNKISSSWQGKVTVGHALPGARGFLGINQKARTHITKIPVSYVTNMVAGVFYPYVLV